MYVRTYICMYVCMSRFIDSPLHWFTAYISFSRSLKSCNPNVQGTLCEQLSSMPHPPDHSSMLQEGHVLSNVQGHSPSQQEGHTLSNAQDHSPSQREGHTLSNAQDHSSSQQEGQTLSTAQDPSPSRPPLPRTQSQFASALEEKESLLKQHEDTISEQLK